MIQVKHGGKRLTKLVRNCAEHGEVLASSRTQEKNKGRYEQRYLRVFEPCTALKEGWPTIGRVLSVARTRTEKGKTTCSTHYYISSMKTKDVAGLLAIIRGHWQVENNLHWVKDVIMGEDRAKFHNYKTFKMNALYRNIVISMIKTNRLGSVKYALETFCWNPRKIMKIIRT